MDVYERPLSTQFYRVWSFFLKTRDQLELLHGHLNQHRFYFSHILAVKWNFLIRLSENSSLEIRKISPIFFGIFGRIWFRFKTGKRKCLVGLLSELFEIIISVRWKLSSNKSIYSDHTGSLSPTLSLSLSLSLLSFPLSQPLSPLSLALEFGQSRTSRKGLP